MRPSPLVVILCRVHNILYVPIVFIQKINNLKQILKKILTFLSVPFTIWAGDKDIVLKYLGKPNKGLTWADLLTK